jgi:hypothetical protein
MKLPLDVNLITILSNRDTQFPFVKCTLSCESNKDLGFIYTLGIARTGVIAWLFETLIADPEP